MEISSVNISCAVRQVYQLSYEIQDGDLLKTFIKLINPTIPKTPGDRAFIFSDLAEGYGATIAEGIRKLELGSLTETPAFPNGNYGNKGGLLKIWAYIPDKGAVKKYLEGGK